MADRSLRILQVSSADVQGGAEQVAWNLFAAYRTRGHRSKLIVGVKRSRDPDVLVIPNEESRGPWARGLRRLSSRLRTGDRETPMSRLTGILAEPRRRLDRFRGVEDFHYPGTARLLELVPDPHVVHLHNLHGEYFDLRLLPLLSRSVPVVVTLHDAWLLSGHCAHPFDCERWRDGCGGCPDLGIYPAVERDATAYNWRRKRDIYRRSRIVAVSPCRWLDEKVQRSILAPALADAVVIPNGIDLEVFRPGDRAEARSRLGIRQDAAVLLSVGVGPHRSMWRDFGMLRASVVRARQELPPGSEVLVIAIGDDAPDERSDGVGFRFLPMQRSGEDMAFLHRAADLYLHPARVDTFPLSVLEALASGTAVVATAVGGIPEQIEDGRSGFLVQAGDVEGMARRIVDLLRDDGLRKGMGQRARSHAQARFSLDAQVDAYLDRYARILADGAWERDAG
jgi:glycosyltransferase involved in cell wall biosynthesis